MKKITLEAIANVENLKLACIRILKTEPSRQIPRLKSDVKKILNDEDKLKSLASLLKSKRFKPFEPIQLKRVKLNGIIQTITILKPEDEGFEIVGADLLVMSEKPSSQ